MRALVALVLWALPASAESICVTRVGAVEGLEARPLQIALRIEGRKRGEVWRVTDDGQRCRAGLQLVVGPGTRARVVGASDGLVELGDVPPDDRAAEVARAVLDARLAPVEPPALVEAELPRLGPLLVDSVGPQPESATSIRGFVAASGLWGFETGPEESLGEVAVEGGVALLGNALEVGLKVGFQPVLDRAVEAADVAVQSLPASVVVRGGLRWGPVSLRVGSAIGVEWRWLDIAPTSMAVKTSERLISGFVDGELELAGHVGDHVRLGLTGGVRGWTSWTRVGWDGEEVYRSPTFAVGVGLRVTVAFGAPP